MKYINEYRDSSLVKPLVRELKKSLTRPVRLLLPEPMVTVCWVGSCNPGSVTASALS